MVMPSIALLNATIPMIVAAGVTIKVIDATFKKNGMAVGVYHYHFTERKASSKKAKEHQHEGGGRRHRHTGLYGYGRTRKSLTR